MTHTKAEAITYLASLISEVASLGNDAFVEMDISFSVNKNVVAGFPRLRWDYNVTDKCPVVAGTRVRVDAVLEDIEDGQSFSHMMDMCPAISEDDIMEALAYDLARMEKEGRLKLVKVAIDPSEMVAGDVYHFYYKGKDRTGRIIRHRNSPHSCYCMVMIHDFDDDKPKWYCWDHIQDIHWIKGA
jgi:uncharacterized protein (DUF433 family)